MSQSHILNKKLSDLESCPSKDNNSEKNIKNTKITVTIIIVPFNQTFLIDSRDTDDLTLGRGSNRTI